MRRDIVGAVVFCGLLLALPLSECLGDCFGWAVLSTSVLLYRSLEDKDIELYNVVPVGRARPRQTDQHSVNSRKQNLET